MFNFFIFLSSIVLVSAANATGPCQGQRQAYIEAKVTQMVRVEGHQEPFCLAHSRQISFIQNRMCPIIIEMLQFGIPVSCSTPLNSKLNGLIIIDTEDRIIHFKEFSYRYPEMIAPTQPLPELGIH